MNPDLAPNLPEGVTPMTFAQMYDHVLGNAIADPEKAWKAVAHLIDSGYVEWWGMSEDNLPTYVPCTRGATYVYLIRSKQ